MTKNELAALLRTIHKASVLEAEAKAAKAAVKQYLLDNNLDSITAGGFNATIKTVNNSRLDSAALKAAEPELYKQYTITESVTRLYTK